MSYLYLISSVFLLASSSILAGFFHRKNVGRVGITSIFNVLLTTSVFLSWLLMFFAEGAYDWAVLPYSVLFALGYTVCNIGNINALKHGSVMLTSLFGQLSLLLVSIWGFFFWDESFTWTVGLGLVLTAIALWLCLYHGKSQEKTKLNFKWIFYVSMGFCGNAAAGIAQRSQQIRFDGEYGNFLMAVATGLSALSCLVLFLRSDKRDTKAVIRGSWYFPVLSGVLNAVLNLFIIFMATSDLSPSLIYPVLGIGSLIIITVTSLFIFREKMRWWQWLGVFLGIAATGILSV